MANPVKAYSGPIFTVFAIAVFGALIAYALLHGSSSESVQQPTNATPSRSIQGIGVGFLTPRDGATVANPIIVHLVIAGLKLDKASEPVKPGFGHMGIIIDGDIPAEGSTFVADATHIDLSNAEVTTTLPNIEPGKHTLSVVFLNSGNISSGPLTAQTIHVTVS
jgi:hypothetical protein